MATIDASIPLQVRPVELPNQLAQFAQVQQIQGLQQHNRLADLQFAEAQRAAQTRDATNAAYQNALAPDGTLDQNKLVSSLVAGGQGSSVPAVQKSFADLNKSTRESQKAGIELALQKQAAIAQLAGAATDQQSWTAALSQAQSMGVDVSNVPQMYSPQAQQTIVQQSLTGLQRLQEHAKQVQAEEMARHNRATESNSAAQVDISRGNLAVNQGRLALERNAPRGQVVTTGDGALVLVDPRSGTSQPVTDGGGQQLRGKTPGQPTATQIENARGKLQTVSILRQQLDNLKQQRTNLGAMSQGMVTGHVPTEAGRNYDAALSALQTTVRQLTRTPGEGAMSDFESRLSQAQLPSRADYGSAIDLKIQQLEDLADTIEKGYGGMLVGGSQRPSAGPTGPSVAPSQLAVPAPGTVHGGYRFKGGDPSQQSSWEKL